MILSIFVKNISEYGISQGSLYRKGLKEKRIQTNILKKLDELAELKP